MRCSAHSMRPSDSPSTCMLDYGPKPFSSRPAASSPAGVDGVSRFSRVEFPCMPGVLDCAEPCGHLRWRIRRCCLPPCGTTSALWSRLFRSSIPGLHVPLSTLRLQPCDCKRMTRGQDGSLLLSCVTLSFTTPRRFIPAHSASCYARSVGKGALGRSAPWHEPSRVHLAVHPVQRIWIQRLSAPETLVT